MDLAAATWPEVADAAAATLLAVPLGSTEQHGPHLVLGTDTAVAVAVAVALARRRPDVAVAPALPYGASGEHAGFPGTLSAGTAATAHLLIELVRSADAFRGVVLVSAHGGNADAVAAAARTAAGEGRAVLAWAPPAARLAAVAAGHGGSADAHAGWVETSLLLAIDPTLVRPAEARPGERRPLGELATTLRADGVLGVSPSGVLGDPTGASPAAGHALLDACVEDLLAAVTARFGPPGPDPARRGPGSTLR